MRPYEPATSIKLPAGIHGKLHAFRRRLRRVKLVEGIGGAAFGLALSYVLLFGLDRLWDTPTWARWTLLLAGMAGPVVVLPMKLHRWFWQQRRLEQVARLLRSTFPRLGDQLLGVIELARTDSDGHRSQTLVHAAMQQVDQASRDQDFTTAVPSPRHMQWAAAAGAACLLVAATFLTLPEAAWNAAHRWLTPWRDVERYTFAQLDLGAQEQVVAFGVAFDVPVGLKDASGWKPETATAQYRQQAPVQARLYEGGYRFKMPAQRVPGVLEIHAGDDREVLRIVPLHRPELLALKATVELPAYLQYEQPVDRDGRSGTLSVLTGSRVQLEATISRELAEGNFGTEPATIEGSKLKSPWLNMDTERTLTASWTDIHALRAKEPLHLHLEPTEDQAPTLQVRTTLDDRILLEDEVATFDISARDDYGIRQIGIEWKSTEKQAGTQALTGWKPAAPAAPQQRELRAKAAFRPKAEGIQPQSIELRAFAEDYLPGRARAYSEPFILHILSNEAHAQWIAEQLHQWQRRAVETYEAELDLNQRNKEIRNLAVEELNNPATRNLIEQQAAAEEANARQLGDLAQAGEGLLRQATRNPDFEGDQLEPLAQVLQSLKDIANHRMPSVADLLSKAADAPASPVEAAPQAGVTKATAPSPAQPPAAPPPPSPSVTDTESTLANNNQSSASSPPGSPAKPVLGLPATTIPGAPGSEPENQPQDTTAALPLEQAVQEQDRLLEEFAKVAEELNQILMNLEGSTFVKRLKAASRKQMGVAGELHAGLLDSFGSDAPDLPESRIHLAAAIARTQTEESTKIRIIHEDMEAFYERVQEEGFRNIIDQMAEHGVVRAVHKIGEAVQTSNHSGQSIAGAEFWADKLDIWADGLAAACEASQSAQGQGAQKESLPPDVVLEVLRILQEEVELRESTRSLHQAREALTPEKYADRAVPLQEKQSELEDRTFDTVARIRELPESARHFRKDMALLLRVAQVMEDAADILSQPNTGPKAIAAETEAIELLLQAKKINGQSSGGNNGGNSPNGGGQGTTRRSALALLGDSDDADADIRKRKVGQSTGTSGGSLPAEFREGLDAYFNALEKPDGTDIP